MNKLSLKLTGTILLVVVICMGLMAYMVNTITASEFDRYVSQGNMSHTRQIADELGKFYSEHGQWTGVDTILGGLVWSNNSRIVLTDKSGLIAGDSGDDWLGSYSADIGLSNGTIITVSGENAGVVFVLVSTQGNTQGSGHMGGHGGWQSVNNADTVLDSSQQDFLKQVNKSIWIAAIIGIAVALILGLFLAQYLIKPIKALTVGARHIAKGNLKYRVKVTANDEIGELATTFNSMVSELEKNNERQRQLMADIAHELRTPLTVIGGTVDGMIDGVFPNDSERLGTIKEQTATLTRLISELRDISLAETGQLKLKKTRIDISQLVKNAAIKFKAAANEKGIDLKVTETDGLPQLNIDSFRIEQVINNLLTNALRYTPDGGVISVQIEIKNRNPKFDEKHILISIKDSGEGISPEHLPYIFDRFYRVKSSRSRDGGGTGLGLSIAYRMVQAHNGRLWAESKPKGGSIFYIALPINNNYK